MIAFVILHYQALDETLDCIETIKNKVSSNKKIIIVDNASPNGSGNKLLDYFKDDSEVEVLISSENIGFARGNNLGYERAKDFKPSYIVVMNNDVFLTQDNFLELVEDSYKKYHFDVLGPDIFSTKTSLHQNPQSERNYTFSELKKTYKKLVFKNKFKFLLKIKYFFRSTSDDSEIQRIDYENVQFGKPLHGAAYIFSEKFIKNHNECFFPDTFMYFESYILHYSAMKEKQIFVYDPTIKVIHHEDVSTNQSYKGLYKKVVFVNKCLLESCRIFLDIMKEDEDKK